jgi:hypothetical protein
MNLKPLSVIERLPGEVVLKRFFSNKSNVSELAILGVMHLFRRENSEYYLFKVNAVLNACARKEVGFLRVSFQG